MISNILNLTIKYTIINIKKAKSYGLVTVVWCYPRGGEMLLEPLLEGDFEFESKITGGAIPKEYIPGRKNRIKLIEYDKDKFKCCCCFALTTYSIKFPLNESDAGLL